MVVAVSRARTDAALCELASRKIESRVRSIGMGGSGVANSGRHGSRGKGLADTVLFVRLPSDTRLMIPSPRNRGRSAGSCVADPASGARTRGWAAKLFNGVDAMDSTFWHERWALKQIAFHQNEVHSALTGFWPEVSASGSGSVFVPLCGKSRDMGWLRDYGHSVVGVELSPVAVAEFFAEASIDPVRSQVGSLTRSAASGITLYTGDFFALQPAELADCRLIYDRGSLIALPPAMRRDYVARLRQLFPHGARILLVTLDYRQGEMNGPPFAVTEAEVRQFYGTVQVLSREDVLTKNPQLRQRGVSQLFETVYLVELAGQAG